MFTASEVSSSRRSSDLSITSVESFASSSMATSVTSGMSRSYPQSPDCIPPIDPIAIHEIENQARTVAENVDNMLDKLKNSLHKVSLYTRNFLVVKICTTVTQNVTLRQKPTGHTVVATVYICVQDICMF